MGREKKAEHFYFDEKSITLYSRSGSRYLQARIMLEDGGGFVKSTGKTEIAAALKIARMLKAKAEVKAEMGIDVSCRTFRYAADKFMERKEDDVRLGLAGASLIPDYTGILRRYLLPFWGRQHLNAITQTLWDEYEVWRDNYWITGPGSKVTHQTFTRKDGIVIKRSYKPKACGRMNNEDTLFRQILAFAAARGWCELPSMLVMRTQRMSKRRANERLKRRRRPAFTENQITKLFVTADERCDFKHERIQYDRRVFSTWIKLLYHSGLRPGREANRLRWSDVSRVAGGEVTIRVASDTKTGARTCIAEPGIWPVLEEFRTLTKWNRAGDYIFADYVTGNPIVNFSRSWRNLMKACAFKKAPDGSDYAPYSLRHVYATERLESGMDVRLVAKNMGTSLQMIEQHYGHDTPLSRVEEFAAARARAMR